MAHFGYKGTVLFEHIRADKEHTVFETRRKRSGFHGEVIPMEIGHLKDGIKKVH